MRKCRLEDESMRTIISDIFIDGIEENYKFNYSLHYTFPVQRFLNGNGAVILTLRTDREKRQE